MCPCRSVVATSTTWAVSWTGATARCAAMSRESIAVQYTSRLPGAILHIFTCVYIRYSSAYEPTHVGHQPPAHRRRAHPAPDPQLPGGGAALRFRSPVRPRPPAAHRQPSPAGAAAGPSWSGTHRSPSSSSTGFGGTPARSAACSRPFSTRWCMTMPPCARSATARPSAAARTPEAACRTPRPTGRPDRRGRHDLSYSRRRR